MDLVRVQVIQSARCQSNLAKPCRGLLARRRENADAPFHRDGAHARPIQPRAGCFGARAAAGAYPKLPFSTVAVHELGQLHEAYKHLRSSRHGSCGRLKTLCGPLGSAVRYRGGLYVIGTATERYRLGSGPQHPLFAARPAGWSAYRFKSAANEHFRIASTRTEVLSPPGEPVLSCTKRAVVSRSRAAQAWRQRMHATRPCKPDERT